MQHLLKCTIILPFLEVKKIMTATKVNLPCLRKMFTTGI